MIVYQAFNKHQINIDDTDEEDVLVHFLPAIAFIQAELDNDRGVLVHCQAGMSASCYCHESSPCLSIYGHA